ncbi:unnamed protein product [Arctogadus glacialis]
MIREREGGSYARGKEREGAMLEGERGVQPLGGICIMIDGHLQRVSQTSPPAPPDPRNTETRDPNPSSNTSRTLTTTGSPRVIFSL